MSGVGCVLCRDEGGELLWADARCRVIRVTGAEGRDFPGFCRVIWQAHVAEMSDLAAVDAAYLMRIVLAVERTLREVMHPDKINLASLGNVVPHLHWHVIPRWHDDSHFPAPVWAIGCRLAPTRPQSQLPSATLAARLLQHLSHPETSS